MQDEENRKEIKRVKKEKRKRRWKKVRKVTGITVLSLFVMGVGAVSVLAFKYKPAMQAIVDDSNKKIASINEGTFKSRTDTVLYDNKGNVMTKLADHHYYYVDSQNMNRYTKNAFVAIEDNRFMQHNGVDVKANFRALASMIQHKGRITQGGSTITQQLVKNVFLNSEQRFSRKLEEMLIAIKLEKIYSKDQIMEYYVNNIYFGSGAYGIDTASRMYFSKPSKDLTLSEVALLAGVPNNPSHYNPIQHMNYALQRRNLILTNMRNLHLITQAEYQKALSEKIVLHLQKEKIKPDSYAISFVLSSATKLLMEHEGFTFKYAFASEAERATYNANFNELFNEVYKQIRNGGYQIHSTIDLQKQQLLQDSINKGLTDFSDKNSNTGLYKTQGAGVSIDNQTGDVVAIVGGRTQSEVANTFNRAFLSYRQPGSSIKPLVAYTPAFERGMLASSTMVDDAITNGPINAEHTFYGSVDMRFAVNLSLNTIPFKIVEKYGAGNMVKYLTNMEFSNIVNQDKNPIIGIGGFTYGTTPLEMAGAYATLEHNGQYIRPTGISKIEDVTNTVLYENKHDTKQIYDSGASYLMTDVLKGVVTGEHSTGHGLGIYNIPTAAKTGTTDDSKDGWFAGYTPYNTTVVWVGNDNPVAIPQLYGRTYPGEIWHNYMLAIHKGLPSKDFTVPSRISYMYHNPYTGEVDANDSHGWWTKELIPKIYVELRDKAIAEAEAKARAKARAEEEARKNDYKKFGLTQEQETQRETYANTNVTQLENAHVLSPNDFMFIDALITSTKRLIDDVKHQDAYYPLIDRYNNEVQRLDAERYAVEHPAPVLPPQVMVPVQPTVQKPVNQAQPKTNVPTQTNVAPVQPNNQNQMNPGVVNASQSPAPIPSSNPADVSGQTTNSSPVDPNQPVNQQGGTSSVTTPHESSTSTGTDTGASNQTVAPPVSSSGITAP